VSSTLAETRLDETGSGTNHLQARSSSTLCPAVAKSLEEANFELLTFFDFPTTMWKSLRPGLRWRVSINRGIPSVHEDARLLEPEDAVLLILYGLVAINQVQLRRIDDSCRGSSQELAESRVRKYSYQSISPLVTPHG
jgi:hypothetical protein